MAVSVRPSGTFGRASLWRLSQSSSTHKCRSHLGFSLVPSHARNCRIESMVFRPGVLDAETPVDDGPGLIALPLQGMDPPAEGFVVREPLPQAAAGDDAELNFRHTEPTAVHRRLVKLQPLGYAQGLRCRKGLVQRRLAMGVQVVLNHSNHPGLRVGLIHQPAHLVGEVLFGAPFRYLQMPPSPPGVRRPGTGCGQQLGGGLIEADHRPLGVVGFGIQVQDILHVSHKADAHRGDAPLFPLPRLEDVFFRYRRTVSWDRDSTTPSSTILSANRRRFQWSPGLRVPGWGPERSAGLRPGHPACGTGWPGPVQDRPGQPLPGETPLDPEHRAPGHIQGLGHLGREPVLIGFEQDAGPGRNPGQTPP